MIRPLSRSQWIAMLALVTGLAVAAVGVLPGLGSATASGAAVESTGVAASGSDAAASPAISGSDAPALLVKVDDGSGADVEADDRRAERRRQWRRFWRMLRRWRRSGNQPAPTTTTTSAPSAATTAAPKPPPTTSPDPDSPGDDSRSTTTAMRPEATTTMATRPPTTRPAPTTAPSTTPTTAAPRPTPAPTTAPATSTTAAPRPPSNGNSTVWRITAGTDERTTMDTSEPAGAGSAHGTRIYCVASHISHDDSIVYPGRPGAAHAHLFWGNTGTDANSTGASLLRSGNSSCEGGLNNRSAYWVPVLYNDRGEAVVPEAIFVYYKSFFRGDIGDRSTIRPIPNGLEMLAHRNVAGADDGRFRINNHDGKLRLEVGFPQCVAVDGSGNPVLSSADNVSHLAYGHERTLSNCPASHPYRIPTVTYIITYGVNPNSAWSLASDDPSAGAAGKGASLHADYIAAWDPASMQAVVECNILARRNCSFAGNRGQLPERFNAPDGTRVYQNSVALVAGADRTPFGSSIPRMMMS